MRMIAAFLLSLVAVVSANLYVTSPTGSTVWPAGQNATIKWQDDGTTPNLTLFGQTKVSVYVGNAIQQTSVQLIVASVDVSTTSAIVFIPDPTVGTSGNYYFIRFESLNLKDAANPQYPALAFSSKFTLTGMTGQFTPAEQAQISGANTAPLGGSTTPSLPTSTPNLPVVYSSTVSSSGSRTSSSVQTTASSGAVFGASASKPLAGILAGAMSLVMLF